MHYEIKFYLLLQAKTLSTEVLSFFSLNSKRLYLEIETEFKV